MTLKDIGQVQGLTSVLQRSMSAKCHILFQTTFHMTKWFSYNVITVGLSNIQIAFYKRCPMQSHDRQLPAGNVSCNLIADNFMQEMSHGNVLCNLIAESFLQETSPVIALQTASCRKYSCNFITDSFLQEMSHVIALQTASCRKCLM